jgi:hypothetical protein
MVNSGAIISNIKDQNQDWHSGSQKKSPDAA